MTCHADLSSEVLAKEVPSAQEKASHVVRPLEIRAENMFWTENAQWLVREEHVSRSNDWRTVTASRIVSIETIEGPFDGLAGAQLLLKRLTSTKFMKITNVY
jgi:hypothetical protein